jgi:hypothetical protein
VVIRSNELAGGQHTVHALRPRDVLRDVRITGNRFRRDHDPLRDPLSVPPSTQLADNTFVDGGAVTTD